MRTCIAVTGASGFLGQTLSLLAQQSGYKVTALVRGGKGINYSDKIVSADLADTALLATAFTGVQAVVHCAGLAHVFGGAGRDEAAYHRVNALGTASVATAASAAGVPHLVLASSVSVYGGMEEGGGDESVPPHPKTPYARSKLDAEQVASDIFGPRGIVTTIRLATLYGEQDRGNIVRLIRSLDRRRFVWPGSGTNRKSLLYKEDAAAGVLACIAKPVDGVFNLSAPAVSMHEIVNAICTALGRPAPTARIPEPLLRALLRHLPEGGRLSTVKNQLRKFLQDDVYPTDLFTGTFSFQPSISLQEGIAREVAWWRSQQF